MASQLQIDQSVSHDGVCLTVVETHGGRFRVSAVAQTLEITQLKEWKPGRCINLERAIRMGDRLDGHFVQGHVDGTAICVDRQEVNGSHIYRFQIDQRYAPLVIEKGSVCLQGVSLTAYDLSLDVFSVSVIPYTYAHTNFRFLDQGEKVNIEFDVLGKYFLRGHDLAGYNQVDG